MFFNRVEQLSLQKEQNHGRKRRRRFHNYKGRRKKNMERKDRENDIEKIKWFRKSSVVGM